MSISPTNYSDSSLMGPLSLEEKQQKSRVLMILLYNRTYDYELMELEREFDLELQGSYKLIFDAINKGQSQEVLKKRLISLLDMPEFGSLDAYVQVCLAICETIKVLLTLSCVDALVGTTYIVIDLLVNGIVLEKVK